MQIKSKEDAKQVAKWRDFIVSVIVLFFMKAHYARKKRAWIFQTGTYIDDDHSFLNADMAIECKWRAVIKTKHLGAA